MALRLFVCPEVDLDALLESEADVELVAFGSPDRPATRPPSVPNDRCHLFAFNDIAAPRDALVAPSEVDVGRLIAVARGTGASALVHQCWFGVSRSTAALLVSALARELGTPDGVARSLRAQAPWATPNPLVIAHGDRLLSLERRTGPRGRTAIGRGETDLGRSRVRVSRL